jgi:hypothetical protein
MNDITNANVNAPEEKSKRPARGDHTYLGPKGETVESIEDATGISYKDLATGEVFTYQIPGAQAGSVQTMFALFGAKTRATNAASAARQARERDASFLRSDVEHITATFGETQDGQWAVAGEGTRAPTYDHEILADVICELLAQAGKTQDRGKVLDKLNNDVKYKRGATGNPQIKAAYFAKVGREASVDSLAVD